MTTVTFSAQMMETLSFLSKNMTAYPDFSLPRLTSMGEEIKSIDELSAAMGIDRKVAAAYAIQSDNEALMDEATNLLEDKAQYFIPDRDRTVVRGHAFLRKNGTYSHPISTVADLKNAIVSFEQTPQEDREKYAVFLAKRARQLKRPELIPNGWKTGEPMDIEVKKPVSAMNTTPLDRSPKKNWVEIAGQLPPYIRAIAHALIRDHGFTVSRAIATAVSRIKAWIASPHTSPEVKAKATKALAQWEALRAKSKAKKATKKG